MEQIQTVENLRKRLSVAMNGDMEGLRVEKLGNTALIVSGYIGTYHMTRIVNEFSLHFLTNNGLVIGDLE